MPVFIRSNKGPCMETHELPVLYGKKLIIEREPDEVGLHIYPRAKTKDWRMELSFKSRSRAVENFEVDVPARCLWSLVDSVCQQHHQKARPGCDFDERTVAQLLVDKLCTNGWTIFTDGEARKLIYAKISAKEQLRKVRRQLREAKAELKKLKEGSDGALPNGTA